MNKLTIPAILVATVMVAGMFAFMPVQQASTVHTTGTITIADDAITEAKIAPNAIGASEIALNAIGADELATTAVAEIADEMLEIREVTNTDVVYDPAQAITITGAVATDEFTVLTVIMAPGTGGDPADATDEIIIDGLTVDGALGVLTANGATVDLTAGGLEVIGLVDIINLPTGNVIGFELSDGTAPPANTESLSVTVKILIRNSAADPVITIE